MITDDDSPADDDWPGARNLFSLAELSGVPVPGARNLFSLAALSGVPVAPEPGTIRVGSVPMAGQGAQDGAGYLGMPRRTLSVADWLVGDMDLFGDGFFGGPRGTQNGTRSGPVASGISLAELSGVARGSADVATIVDKLVGGAGADRLVGAALVGEENPWDHTESWRQERDRERLANIYGTGFEQEAELYDYKPELDFATALAVAEAAIARRDPSRAQATADYAFDSPPAKAGEQATADYAFNQNPSPTADERSYLDKVLDFFWSPADFDLTEHIAADNSRKLSTFERFPMRELTIEKSFPGWGTTVLDPFAFAEIKEKAIADKLADGSRLPHNVLATIATRNRVGVIPLTDLQLSRALWGTNPILRAERRTNPVARRTSPGLSLRTPSRKRKNRESASTDFTTASAILAGWVVWTI